MTIREFIKQNRAAIDQVINQDIYRWDGNGGRGTIPNPAPTYNDEERRKAVLNIESLYSWACSEGVNP